MIGVGYHQQDLQNSGGWLTSLPLLKISIHQYLSSFLGNQHIVNPHRRILWLIPFRVGTQEWGIEGIRAAVIGNLVGDR